MRFERRYSTVRYLGMMVDKMLNLLEELLNNRPTHNLYL